MRMLILTYMIQLVIPNVCTNFKILGAVVPKKSLTNIFIGEKEKWKNKGNDKHEYADSFLHDTSSCT